MLPLRNLRLTERGADPHSSLLLHSSERRRDQQIQHWDVDEAQDDCGDGDGHPDLLNKNDVQASWSSISEFSEDEEDHHFPSKSRWARFWSSCAWIGRRGIGRRSEDRFAIPAASAGSYLACSLPLCRRTRKVRWLAYLTLGFFLLLFVSPLFFSPLCSLGPSNCSWTCFPSSPVLKPCSRGKFVDMDMRWLTLFDPIEEFFDLSRLS
jgi:hypothetical protein